MIPGEYMRKYMRDVSTKKNSKNDLLHERYSVEDIMVKEILPSDTTRNEAYTL